MDFTIFKPDEDEESKPGTPADSAEGSTTAEKVGNIVSFSVESPDPYMSVAEAAEMLGVTEDEVNEAINRCLIPAKPKSNDIDGKALPSQIMRKIFLKNIESIRADILLDNQEEEEEEQPIPFTLFNPDSE